MLEQLLEMYSENLWIKITPENLEQAKKARLIKENQTQSNQAFYNHLCVNILEKWLLENLNLDLVSASNPQLKPPINHQLFGSADNLAIIWSFINGSIVNIYDKRLILIPNDAMNIEGFEIEQEWVDIPNLAGDYYLPVRVDLEANYLHIWGFISRQTLKQTADFDEFDKLYIVDNSNMIDEIDTLWMALDMCQKKDNLESLDTLTESQAKQLIQEYSEPSPYSPRLKGNFKQWSALLNNEQWLKELYELSQKRLKPEPVNEIKRIKLINWDWVNKFIDEGWQNLNEFLNQQKPQVAFRFRAKKNPTLSLVEIITRFIKAQKEFSFSDEMNQENMLVYLFENTQQEHIRWQAVEYLWKLNPLNPQLPLIKILDLGVQLKGNSLALMVGVLPKKEQKVAVFLRTFSLGLGSYLPTNLQLRIFDDQENLFMEAKSRDKNDWIQLYFTADEGDCFNVRLSLETASITQYFAV